MKPLCSSCKAPAFRRFTLDNFAIYRCEACDLEFVAPTPTQAQLAAVYEKDYFSGTGHGYNDYFGSERSEVDRKALTRAKLLQQLQPPKGPWLDVGCADGRFVLAVKSLGIDAYGVEPSPEAQRAIAPALRPFIASELSAIAAHAPFAVVTFWDVLEHLPDPFETLHSVRPLLAKEALLAAVTPVINNSTARWFPSQWDQYKPPEHLWFFSQRSLRNALLQASNGTFVHEETAWTRADRFCSSRSFSALQRWTRLRAFERTVTNFFHQRGWIPSDALTDAALVVVRTPA